MVFIKLALRNSITSSTKCLLPSLTFIIGANTTTGSTQRSLMSYFHLLHFLLHFAALPFFFLDSILTYIELFALCSPFPELLNKLFPSQELSFLFIGAIYCLISNYQLGLSDFTLEKHSTQRLPKLQVQLPVKASSQCLISTH